MWDGMNRREFPRVDYKCTITIQSRSGTPKTISTRTENVGIGGVCIVLKEPLELFSKVALELVLDDGNTPIRTDGSVMWVIKSGPASGKGAPSFDTGVEFSKLRELDKERITKVVKKVLSS